MPITSSPKTLEEVLQLQPKATISIRDAIALCFEPDDIEKGRVVLEHIKSQERMRIHQREISGTIFQLLWGIIGAVGAHKAWVAGYWPISTIIGIVWLFTSWRMFASIRAEYHTRFAEIIFADENESIRTQPTIEAGIFRQYLTQQKELAANPWSILEFGPNAFPPAITRDQQKPSS